MSKSKSQQTPVLIESLDQEGRGVAHHEGKVIFIEGALTGEWVTFLQTYIPKHNERFAVFPADDQDAHIPCLLDGTALARACAIQHRRKLDKNLTLSFRRQRYIIQTGDTPRYALRGQAVTVVEYPDGRIELLRGAESLPFKVFDKVQSIITAVDDKTLNVRVDELLKQRHHQPHVKPHSEHPWRKPYNPRLIEAAQLRI